MRNFRLICICTVLLAFMAGPAVAQIGYQVDFLEPGNSGGWSGSLKTFGDEWTLSPGDTVETDIWLTDSPEALLTAGYIIQFNPALVAITDFIAYDTANGGPWDADLSNGSEFEPGTWFLAVGNLACVTPDADGDIILGKVTFECQGLGNADIAITPIGGFDTVVGCAGTIYDSGIPLKSVTIIQEGSGPVCGDGIIEDPEVCDGENLAGETCESQGFDGGTLACSTDCLSFDTTSCTSAPVCGDGIIESPEVCDGENLAGETCESQGFDGGTLACSTDCLSFDTTSCTSAPVCGDGIIESPEVCDGENLAGETCESQGFDGGTLACSTDCLSFDTTSCTLSAVCGDGIIEDPEVCDGENLAGETCESQGFDGGTLACSTDCLSFDTTSCTLSAVCGDGIIEDPEVCDGENLAGETCESQGFDGGTLACSADCLSFDTTSCTLSAVCGDGIIEDPEVCDGENLAGETCESQGFDGGTLACSADCLSFDTTSCTLSAVCGDGIIEDPEVCDGENLAGETCESQGFDGGTLDCSADCLSFDTTSCTLSAVCGDGIIEDPEVCDGENLAGETCESLGFAGGTLACSGDCLDFDTTGCTGAPVCGDGIIEDPEVCDGENLAGETCESLGFAGGTLVCSGDCLAFDTTGCTGAPVCGDGTIEPPEVCDGGNLDGETCESLGFTGGTLACSGDCLDFDTTGCFLDSDGDGLPDPIDPCPFDQDCDDDGLTDGPLNSEDLNANGVVDPGETDPANKDTDNDGILDGTESGLAAPETPDTDLTIFVPDADPSTTTDPTNPDSDGDGIPDGEEDTNQNGLFEPDLGETNPNGCGNGIIEPGEQCDGSNLNGETCESLGFAGGDLACSGCSFDTSGCFSDEAIMVNFDIKPSSLNMHSKGVLPAVILRSNHFDIRTIDPGTLALTREGITGGVAPLRYNAKGKDMKLKFSTSALVEVLQLPEVAGQTIPLILTGNLKESASGTPISGKDYVMIKGKGKGDFDADKDVDGKDMHKMKKHFGWNNSDSSCDAKGICEGDFDDDGDIDGIDVSIFKTVFGPSGVNYIECNGDFDCDRDVDGKDALQFTSDFGRGPYANPCSQSSVCPGDFDGDQDCDGSDAAAFKVDFGRNLFRNPCRSCVIQ